jgi:hypothetical protein
MAAASSAQPAVEAIVLAQVFPPQELASRLRAWPRASSSRP